MTKGDEEALRELRLQAMIDAPGAFGSNYDREASRSVSDWQGWFAPGATFVAEDASQGAIGLVAAMRGEEIGVAHLMSMWVRPSFRGTGVSDALVRAVIAWVESQDVTVVRLHVVSQNEAAVKLYARHGFRPTALESIRERDGAIELEMQRT